MFAKYDGQKQVGFREFVIILANAPYQSVFATKFVKMLVEHYWSRYYRAILVKCFIPFILYFVLTLWYMTKIVVSGIAFEERHTLNWEFVNRILIYFLILYFCFFEFVCMVREGKDYLKDIFNYLDMASYGLNFYLLIKTVHRSEVEY